MSLSMRSVEQEFRRVQDQEKDVSSVWNSLGGLRAELLKMEHRLDWAFVGKGSSRNDVDRHSYSHPLQHLVTAPDTPVDNMPAVSSYMQKIEGIKRQVSHAPVLEIQSNVMDKDEKFSDDHPVRQVQESTDCHENPDSRSSDLGRQQDYTNHGLRETKEENPKQDFSRIRLLKEVTWESINPDNLTHPNSSGGNGISSTVNSTYTNSRDIRETEIRFLNFSSIPCSASSAPVATVSSSVITSSSSAVSPPFAPPTSASNFALNFNLILPPSSPLSGSKCSPTEQPNIQWISNEKGYISPMSSYSRTVTDRPTNKMIGMAKVAEANFRKVGSSKASFTASQPTSVEQKHAELLHIRKQLEEKWAQAQHLLIENGQHKDHHQHKTMKDRQDIDSRKRAEAKEGPESLKLNSLKLFSKEANHKEDQPEVMKVTVSTDRKSSKPRLRSIITPSSWRTQQRAVKNKKSTVLRTKSKASGRDIQKVTFAVPGTKSECASDMPDDTEACAADHAYNDDDDGGGACKAANLTVDEMWINARLLSANARNILNELMEGVCC